MPRLLPRVAPDAAAPESPAAVLPADSSRPLRFVHPWAWWAWALSAGAAISLTTNPLVIGLIVVVVVVVVIRRRPDTPWARSLKVYFLMAMFIVAMRLFFQITMGGVRTGTVLFTLPTLQLPAWATGIRIGGPVTVDGLAFALFDAIRLAAMLLCVGAANSLANPRTALKSVPAGLRDISTAIVIALSLIPQLIASVHRVRRGQRLRGGRRRGAGALPGTLIPVIEDSVESSLQLATSMEARGYGRTRVAGQRRRGSAQLLGALLCVLFGIYLLLGVPATGDGMLGLSVPALLAVVLIGAGLALTIWGMRASSRQLGVTRYRPAPWGRPERLTVACGLAGFAVVALLASQYGAPTLMNPPSTPFRWPSLPPLMLVAAALFALPGFLTPRTTS
ncbi:MAG TPA: CbiQ family ECF transporter T component [Arachnia sp.]|nr:CbiQ family ECF transporter T component [Arachnia sp.]HMT87503.1 CbiQ family ECF transporter T component [Arachnia sp.]